jgi:hypothetical protein
MQRGPLCRRHLLKGGMAFVLLSTVSGARAEETAPVPTAAPSAPNSPANAVATVKAPATIILDRPTAPGEVSLDINVHAFTAPRHGAVEAVVTLEPEKAGGREVEVGSFTIFPAKSFKAKTPADERGFRLNATQALSDVGTDSGPVKIKVRLESLRDTHPVTRAKLTLGKVEFAQEGDNKDEKK